MKLYWILFFLISVANQDYDPNCTRYEKDLCKRLFEMMVDDQKYRGTTKKITDFYPAVLDSLLGSKGFSNNDLSSLPELQQGTLKQEALQLAGRKLMPLMAQNDSLLHLQRNLDAKNTEKLIEITKNNGWLTAEGLGCKENFKTVLIFRHAPKKYWEEIKKLIEKERTEKRMSGYEYYVIDNHLKGRPPLTKKPSDFIN